MNKKLTTLQTSLRRFGKDRRGANLVEYMILVGAVALCSLAAAQAFKDKVKEQMDKEGNAVTAIPTT